jgi:hypothetical protein
MSFAAHPFVRRHVPNRREQYPPENAAGISTVPRSASLGKLSVSSSPHLAGFRAPTGHHGPEPGSVAARPLSTQWLSEERIAEARRVWSKAYGRVIGEDEAIEILTNVRRLAEILLRAEEEKSRS